MNLFRFPPFWALLVGAIIFCFMSSANAESIAATPVPHPGVDGYAINGLWYAGSKAQACSAFGGGAYQVSANAQLCEYTANPQIFYAMTAYQSCGSSGSPVLTGCADTYTCPDASWTLNGQLCTKVTCGAGQYLQEGVCKCDNGSQTGTDGSCCPAPGAGGGAAMQWCYVSAPGASTCSSSGNNGCAIRCNNVTYQSGTGDQVQIFPKQALGQQCGYTGLKTPAGTGGGDLSNDQLKEVAEATKDPEKAKSPEGCLASGSGYVTVGGVTSCVASGEGGTVNKTETAKTQETVKNPSTGADETTTNETAKTETTNESGMKSTTTTKTTTNPDGSKVITTITKTQNPDGTVTEAVKVENVTSGGTKTTASDKTGTEGTGSWCDKNPTDPICKKESDQCKLYPDRVGCMDQGSPTTEQGGALESREIGVSSFGVVAVSSLNQCPTGATLPRNLGVYNWEPICDFAGALKPIVLAFAWLSAGLIVIGGIKT